MRSILYKASFALVQLVGSVGGLSVGQWEVQAFVQGVGYALSQQPVYVNVTLNLESSAPAAGGVLGGTLLTVSGIGIDKTALNNIRHVPQSPSGSVTKNLAAFLHY